MADRKTNKRYAPWEMLLFYSTQQNSPTTELGERQLRNILDFPENLNFRGSILDVLGANTWDFKLNMKVINRISWKSF